MANKTVQYLNIGQIHKDDIFYRYKMPAIESVFEGKGNGSKTKIVNIDQVAYALDRSELMIMKYYSIILGTSVKGNIMRGNHPSDELTKILNMFIDTYVLCKKCTNPETTLKSKTLGLRATSKACGEIYYISDNSTIDAMTKILMNKK